MKKSLLLLSCLLTVQMAMAQSVGVGTTNPDQSSKLDIQSTDSGILVPRMTQAQRDNINGPATSLLIYQTNFDEGFYYNRGNPGSPDWVKVGDFPPFTGSQQWYSTFGTYMFIVPSNVYRINYEIAGGGGGSGGNYDAGPTYRGGGGGGGGGFLWGYLEVSPGDTLTIVVGNRGSNGSDGATPSPGTAGGASSISLGSLDLAKVSGGGGGQAASSSSNGNGGSGGAPVTWQTSQSKGIRSLASSLSGRTGLSSTSAANLNYLKGDGGMVCSMGKFNRPSYIQKFQVVGAGVTEGYEAYEPYYGGGSGASPNTQGRWGYVSLYW